MEKENFCSIVSNAPYGSQDPYQSSIKIEEKWKIICFHSTA